MLTKVKDIIEVLQNKDPEAYMLTVKNTHDRANVLTHFNFIDVIETGLIVKDDEGDITGFKAEGGEEKFVVLGQAYR